MYKGDARLEGKKSPHLRHLNMDFPLELQDRIIDHLYDEKHALGTCGLVNKTWLRSSRHHLFSLVALRDLTCEAFVSLLNSPLATFTHSIKTLAIRQTVDLDLEATALLDDVIPEFSPLPALRCFRLAHLAWEGVTASTADYLTASFANITELDLQMVVFRDPHQLAVLVSRFPLLEKVSLQPVFLDDGAAVQVSESHHPEIPRSLTHVRLNFINSSTHDPLKSTHLWLEGTSNNPSPVRKLELGFVAGLAAQSLPSLGKLLRVLGPNLHDLDLKLTHLVTADDIKSHIDLSENTDLKNLTIHLGLRRFRLGAGSQRPHAPWAILSAARSPISTLAIVLTLDAIELLDNLDWAHLNAVLEKKHHLLALQRLHFMVHCSEVMTAAVEAAIRGRVTRASGGRGIVDISFLQPSRVFIRG
ncbi:hypothetical protein B0H16DRAFT_1635400 [Mycena metata]|uniref:F-box domain-containing protein n=1 Tax=Mycena metata TaxID=1033252 RepID=A0AAD7GW70_9AGAR|nr:hypothetical protein B0H16DRAFT_1635400 [Mycena metata]